MTFTHFWGFSMYPCLWGHILYDPNGTHRVRPSLFRPPATTLPFLKTRFYDKSKLKNKQAFFFKLHKTIDVTCNLTFDLYVHECTIVYMGVKCVYGGLLNMIITVQYKSKKLTVSHMIICTVT